MYVWDEACYRTLHIYIKIYIYIYIKIFPLAIGDFRISADRVEFHFSSENNTYTVSEYQQWDRCQIRLKVGHNKPTHGHYMSREQPTTCEVCGEDTLNTLKK